MSTETSSAPPADGGRGTVAVPRVPLWVVVGCALGVVALLLAALAGSEVLEKPLQLFLVEPTSDGRYPWYTGVVSTTGALLWWTAATVSYVTAWIAHATRRGPVGFWLGSAVLSTILALDDLYQGHEYVYPKFLHVQQEVTAVIYAGALVALLVVYRSYVRTLPWRVGLASLAFFVVSQYIDFRFEIDQTERMLFLEEATKLAGIAAWALFFVWASQSVLLARGDSPASPQGFPP